MPVEKYRCFTDDYDQVWAKHVEDGDQIIVLKKIQYFRGSDAQNELAGQAVIKEILKENGIIINTENTPPVPWDYLTYEEWNKDNPDKPLFAFFTEDEISNNGVTYKYFLTNSEGRGWGVILKKNGEGVVELLAEGFITNLTAGLTSLAEDNGIDFKYAHKGGKNVGPGFSPTSKDF